MAVASKGIDSRRIAAYLAVCFIWGSTYLAIRYAVETIPPFLMAGTRLVLAGIPLYLWARSHGAERPRARHWRDAFVVGGLLFMGGHGAVAWGEQLVPSGIAALLFATIPIWVLLLDRLRPSGPRIEGRALVGLIVGLAGVAVLIGPQQLLGGARIDRIGSAILLLGAASWAAGSIQSKARRSGTSSTLATGMHLLSGGALLWLTGLLAGEAGSLDPGALSLRSLLSLAYLVVFGSLVGFAAYTWLLGVAAPARVATYAYVNPLVAVLLGWGIGAEPLTLRVVGAACLIVPAVAVVLSGATDRPARSANPNRSTEQEETS